MAVQVLIIEDDADINEIVATHLTRAGHACTQAYSGTEARLLIEAGSIPGRALAHGDAFQPSTPTPPGAPANLALDTHCNTSAPAHRTQSSHCNQAATAAGGSTHFPFDIVISDLMLPGLSGEKLVGIIRRQSPTVPIIVTSARSAATDKIDLLKLGADDYLTKPFDLDELLIRIEVQLRHRANMTAMHAVDTPNDPSATPAPEYQALRFRNWTLDPEARTFCAGGTPVELTRIDFNIVETLMRHPRRVFSKQELFEQAWGEPYAADDNTVNVHVSNIRSKLKASGTDAYIKTVWGMGFKLVEE